MNDDNPGDGIDPAGRPASSRWPARLSAWLRVLFALPFYGSAWLVIAGVALVWFGGRAGWRDMRSFTGEGEGEGG